MNETLYRRALECLEPARPLQKEHVRFAIENAWLIAAVFKTFGSYRHLLGASTIPRPKFNALAMSLLGASTIPTPKFNALAMSPSSAVHGGQVDAKNVAEEKSELLP